ncbi:MAG: helix-turn-helix domain-containing protein [Lachnospiraceae bacterium]|nr:helix-turn-helix domain-containing protein [Lachnospiraceae bacterium]
MILADKIINERKKLGWSQEELAEKLEVSRQSVSKWESAQSTPDLSRILKMAEIFGVSTDYLLKDEVGESEVKEDVSFSDEKLRPVSMEEASKYLEEVRVATPKTAIGVMLCIISPIVLLMSSDLSERFGIEENVLSAIGIATLLVLIATAVFIFILNGRSLDKYDFLEIEPIDTAYGVDGMVREKKEKYDKKHILFKGIGVGLCIVSAIPLLVSSIMTKEIDGGVRVSFLLAIVAIGVSFIINANGITEACDKLLQEGDYTISGKKANAIINKISGVYWALSVIIYLVWSFTTNDWQFTWIVWPVVGILYGGICGMIKAFTK